MGLLDKAASVFSGGASAGLTLTPNNPRLHRGEEVGFSYAIRPKSSFNCRGVRVELQSVETSSASVGTGSGSRDGTEVSIIHQSKTELMGESTFTENVAKDGTGKILIPADVQPTYNGKNASHVWKLRLVVDIAMGVDLKEIVELTVL
ncbi:hypothetical protein ACFLQ2_04100 [archaeon]